MLLRLYVNGFKNLLDTEIHFGPFTCVAGGNGVGKSNLLEAVRFLNLLADVPFIQAVAEMRGDTRFPFTIEDIFFQGNGYIAPTITLQADMLITPHRQSLIGEVIQARNALLRYEVQLQRVEQHQVALVAETLRSLTAAESRELLRELPFYEDYPAMQPDEPEYFIQTTADQTIQLLAEDHSVTRRSAPGLHLKQSLLSLADPTLFPTAFLVQAEMHDWRTFHFEPAAMRIPDVIGPTNEQLAENGEHIPATLNYLINQAGNELEQADMLQTIATLLARLIGDVRSLAVEQDPQRNVQMIVIEDTQGRRLTPRMLSDGTLRFLAMVLLAQDPRPGVYAIEEPENGLHPTHIAAMLEILQAIALEPAYPVDATNPLHQVIITTHSPVVVDHISDDSLLLAEAVQRRRQHHYQTGVEFRWLKQTWRARINRDPRKAIARGTLISYLAPINASADEAPRRRVRHNPDIQAMLQSMDMVPKERPSG